MGANGNNGSGRSRSREHLIEVEDELPVESIREPLPRCLDGERARRRTSVAPTDTQAFS